MYLSRMRVVICWDVVSSLHLSLEWLLSQTGLWQWRDRQSECEGDFSPGQHTVHTHFFSPQLAPLFGHRACLQCLAPTASEHLFQTLSHRAVPSACAR